MPQKDYNNPDYLNGYNPFSNSDLVDRIRTTRTPQISSDKDSKFRAENFYRNANFILTLFLSGVAMSSLVLYSTVKKNNIAYEKSLYAKVNSNIQKTAKVNTPVDDQLRSIANEMSNTTTVLGAQSLNSSSLASNYAWQGGENLVKGGSTNIIINKLDLNNENEQKVVYIKKSNLFEIYSPELFELPNDWLVIPFDLNGSLSFELKSNFTGSYLLNIFSTNDDESANNNASGDLGYIEVISK